MTATIAPRTGSRVASGRLTGTGAMVRLALRRDRIKLPVWVYVIAAFVPYFYYGAVNIAGSTPQAMAERVRMVETPLMRLFTGPFFGHEATSAEHYFLGSYGVEFMLAVMLMNILLVARHTRAEEQTGRAELIRAAVVGRHAQLTAALAVALIGDAALMVLLAGGGLLIGFPAGSALLFGASVGALGLVFAGLTAVTAQVTEYSRGAAGLAAIGLAVAWALRGAGALQAPAGGPASWLSPMAWSQQTRVLADERWWPLGLSVVLALVLVAAAYTLAGRRDLGAGLVAPRPGRASAPSWLRTPFTLALRLQRAGIIAWGAGFLAGGLTFGAMAGGMTDIALPIFAGKDFVRAYLGIMVLFAPFVVGVFALLAVVRLRADEVRGRIAPVLAGPTGRSAWLGSSLLVVASASIGLLATYGIALGAGAAASTGAAGLAGEALLAVLLRIPEVLVLLAVPAALLGLVPRAVGAAWAVLMYSGFMAVFGIYLPMPGWLVNLSVLSHLPFTPLGEFAPVATVVLLALATALTTLGLYGLRRRDLASG